MAQKGSFNVKTCWLYKHGPQVQALLKNFATVLFWEVNLFFLSPISYQLSTVRYLHDLHYLHCFLIVQERELIANGYRLLRCEQKI